MQTYGRMAPLSVLVVAAAAASAECTTPASIPNLRRAGRISRMSLRGGEMALGSGEPQSSAMSVVFVSAEVAPWSITGGLGAVCDGLPVALAKAGSRVMSIAPRYDQYFDAWYRLCCGAQRDVYV